MNTKRKPEKTQPKNPHGLTINQHVLPAKTIERFAGTDGSVSVFFKGGLEKGKTKRLWPNNPVFCANRVWNHRSEVIAKTTYEDPFQDLADRIIAGTIQVLNSEDTITVTCFWGLWATRFLARKDPPMDKLAVGVTGIESQDLREQLERAGALFISPGGKLSGRDLADMNIQKRIDKVLMDNRHWVWRILEAQSSEFIVPDCPSVLYIPISPQVALLANQPVKTKILLNSTEVENLNRTLYQVADRYIFAKSLNPGTTLWT